MNEVMEALYQRHLIAKSAHISVISEARKANLAGIQADLSIKSCVCVLQDII